MCLSGLLFSQERSLPESIRDLAEELAAADAGQEASASYLDRLYDLAENPVRINTGTSEEISRLFFLSDFQVKALADYVRTTGRIVSMNELQYIPGFDKAAAAMAIPFCRLDDDGPEIPDTIKLRNSLLTNVTTRFQRKDPTDLGSQWRILTKYKFMAGSFTGGFTAEKDPGEKYFRPGTVRPDFFSANLAYSGQGIIRKLIVGDFSARSGQGTNVNTGISTGISLTSQSYMSATNELKPYTSSDENNFFRGIGAMLAFRSLEMCVFRSENKIDATVAPGTSGSPVISGFYSSGLHNTTSLLRKEDTATEYSTGVNFAYNNRFFKTGFTWSHTRFSLPVVNDPGSPEELFDFSGKNNNIFSVYYNCFIKKILCYGELSANDFGRYAIVQGISVKPSDRLTTGFLFTGFSKGYTAFHGKGPGGLSAADAMRCYLGNFTFEAARHFFISGGVCVQHYPWLKYRSSSPSTSVRREIRLKYLPSDRTSIDMLYSFRSTQADDNTAPGVAVPDLTTSSWVKFAARYAVTDNLTLNTRLDFRRVNPSGSRGMLIAGDANYRIKTFPLTIWARVCIFRTGDYDSRIYTWENDLLYTFTIPSLSGDGSRLYAMAGWKPGKKTEIRVKYAILDQYTENGSWSETGEVRLQLKLIIP